MGREVNKEEYGSSVKRIAGYKWSDQGTEKRGALHSGVREKEFRGLNV